MFETRTSAAGLSIVSNSVLIAAKLGVGLLTGSVSIIAEAIHSSVDLLASLITFFSLRMAAKPADKEHPFGHGKIENVSGTAEATLIFVAAAFIVYEAVRKLMSGVVLVSIDWAIAVMAFSMLVNFLVSRRLFKISKKLDSIALEADALNFSTDILTSFGVLAGLAVVRITGLDILDPIVAILVAVLIVKAAFDVLRKAYGGLVDVKLPETEENEIVRSVMEHYGQLLGFHELRSRKAGSERDIDLHVVVPRGMSVEEAHKLIDHIEQDIKSKLVNATVSIHMEPCETTCEQCQVLCSLAKSKGVFPEDAG
ncbi:MAG: cation diffusion facilitator family transporter [Dehalococcoidia bacterium]|nr:cation diffusion facilitator family transporter [Dehalococcoidia bacterium]